MDFTSDNMFLIVIMTKERVSEEKKENFSFPPRALQPLIIYVYFYLIKFDFKVLEKNSI